VGELRPGSAAAEIGDDDIELRENRSSSFITIAVSVAHPRQFGSDSDPACEHRFGFGSDLNKIYHQFVQPLSVNTFTY
jgi:hypothetical protein